MHEFVLFNVILLCGQKSTNSRGNKQRIASDNGVLCSIFFTLSSFFLSSSPCSSSSKQRKNVISCVTVHDSPESDCSSNNSPYAVESRPPNNNSYDTKTTILDNYNNGNPRTIIIPPLKTQSNEVLSECERLMPGE